MNAIAATYLILIIHGQSVWGVPKPYHTLEACELAGSNWDSGSPPDNGTRGHYCLRGPIPKHSSLMGGWQ